MVRFWKLMIVVILILFSGVCMCLHILFGLDARKNFDYKESEKKTIEFLNDNIYELNNLAQKYLGNHNLESQKYKMIQSIIYHKDEELEYVQFEYNSQGMLGGQYWGLLYIPRNKYLGEDNLYIYDAKDSTSSTGNDIFIRKKIKKNWFFYYDDYDGKTNLNDVK